MTTLKLHETSGAIREAVGDAKNRTRRIKIIEAGPGSSAFYPAAVLERDGAVAFPYGAPWTTKSYADHPTMDEEWVQPERSVTKIVGKQVSIAEWDEESQALYADYQFSQKFYDEVVDPFGDVVGMSIYALGQPVLDEHGNAAVMTIGEYTGTVLERLIADPSNSVDVVTVAGAGGAILPKLTEAMKPFVEGTPTEPRRVAKNKENKVDEETFKRLLAEALSAQADTIATKLAEALKPAPVDAEVEEVAAVAEAVATSDLTESGRKRVYESIKVPGMKVAKAIEAEKQHETEIETAVKKRLEESGESFGGHGGSATAFEGFRGFGQAPKAEVTR